MMEPKDREALERIVYVHVPTIILQEALDRQTRRWRASARNRARAKRRRQARRGEGSH